MTDVKRNSRGGASAGKTICCAAGNLDDADGMPRFLTLFVFAALAAHFSAAQGRTEELSARQIIDRAVKADKELRERRTAYEYEYTLKTEKLDRKDQVLATRELKARMRPSKDITYSIEITQDSDKKSDAARKQEEKKMEEAQQLMTKIELEKLVDHYNYSSEGSVQLMGRAVYIVRYTPKPDYIVKSREEKVLHAISGRLWIDRSSFCILKSEGKLMEPTSVAWFFATMREMNFQYTSSFLPNGDPAPASFNFFFDVQVSFGYQRQRQSSTMLNYRKVQ